jgi:two-component system phosphate regulon sensor histidine kinase PhoR
MLATIVICLIVYGLCLWKDIRLGKLFYIILGFSVFSVCFAVYYYAIELFINQKIKLIYKTINRLVTDKKKKQIDMSSDVISEVSDEVVTWAKAKSNEIDRLKETEIYRKDFIGNLSHELKTPIFNIQGYILTLLEGAKDDPEVATKFLKKAAFSVDRMTNLIEDLDALIALESKGPNLKLTQFNVVQSITNIIESLENTARKKQISLVFNLENNNSPIWVNADNAKIGQVMTNLLVNSINYGKEGGQTTVEIHDMDNQIMIEVSDNGIGIEEKHLARIFERFYRVDSSRTKHEGGSGLGLAIVKHILEIHHQRINVNSSSEKGTTFNFTLNKPQKNS